MERNKINLPIETIRQNCNNDWRDAKPNFLDRVEFYCMNDEMADIYFIFKRQGKEQTVCFLSVKFQQLFQLLEDSGPQICVFSCFRSVSKGICLRE